MPTHTITDLFLIMHNFPTYKENLRNALQSKGAVIPEDTPIEDYPAIITNLCS